MADKNYDDLIQKLADIAQIYIKINDEFRARAFSGAATAVQFKQNAGQILPNTEKELKKIPGIGASTAKAIIEWQQSGQIQRLLELREKQKEEIVPVAQPLLTAAEIEKANTIALFETIHGVGEKTAEKWYTEGLRTLDDVQTYKVQILTHAQRIGWKWYHHLLQRIPRTEMDTYHSLLGQALGNLRWEIAGSYRRDLPDSGDVDILIEAKTGYTLDHIVQHLIAQKLLVDKISQGPTKYMGIIRLSPQHIARRIDIRWIPAISWWPALLYFTGSGDFNKRMRAIAKSQGYILNEYSLSIEANDQIIAVNSEQDLFAALGMDYLTPAQRDE